MTDERRTYDRLFELVDQARAVAPDALDAWLAGACDGDEALATQVRELLAAGSDEGALDAFAEDHVEATRRALDGVMETARATWRPETIGDYTIIRQLGQGGMGVVYEAEQASPRRRVAIKLLHPMHTTPTRLARFRQEADLLGRLRHPGIARIFEAGTFDVGHGPQPYFAMELVDGLDIRTHCERTGLDRPARLELLARVADAVQYAHEHGIVHRDLKPDNVLIDEHGHPRVLDFGIARTSAPSTALTSLVTEEGQLVGTLAYMAPEQLSGASDATDPRADVYALGVLAFEVLVGHPPWEIEDLTVSRAIALLADRDAPRAGDFDATLRGDVETILGKALESERERRYESAAALAGDLRRHLAHRPIEARPPSRIYLAAKFTRRHRGLVLGTVTTVITLVLGVIIAAALADEAREQGERAAANEHRALNGVLQGAQILADAGRERDALAQLRLVPEERRGVAWRLLERAVPFVIDEPPGHWRFLDDEHMLGQVPASNDPSVIARDTVLVYSLVEQRVLRELDFGEGLQLWSAFPCGLAVAVRQVPGIPAEMLLLDLERVRVVERSPYYTAVDPAPFPAGHDRAGELYEHTAFRRPEVSDDGRTIVWYTSPRSAEVRVGGDVVRVFEDLLSCEAVHVGPDGRDLVVNRRDEVRVEDIASGMLRFRHAVDPAVGASGVPVVGGVVLHDAFDGAEWNVDPPQAWRRFDLAEGAPLLEPTEPFVEGFHAPGVGPWRVRFSRDGRVVAISHKSGDTMQAWLADPTTGEPLDFATLSPGPHGRGVCLWFGEDRGSQVEVSPSGQRLAVIGVSTATEVVELDPAQNGLAFDGRALTLRGHINALGHEGSGWVYHVAASNDGSLIASSAPADPLIRVWDSRTGEQLATLERDAPLTHTDKRGWESLMAFSEDDDRLVLTTPFGGQGLAVVDWNLLTGSATTVGEALPVDGLPFAALEPFVEVLAPGPRARLSRQVQLLDGRPVVTNQAKTASHRSLARPPTGPTWADSTLSDGTVTGLSVHPRDARVATVQRVGPNVARAGVLTVRDSRSGEELVRRELDYHPWCVAYSPDGGLLAVGTNEGFVLLFETERHTQQLAWPAHDGERYSYIYSLAWTPDGQRLVTASGDATLKVWDTRTRLAARLDTERWRELRAAIAERDDLAEAYPGFSGEERQAARAELMRRRER